MADVKKYYWLKLDVNFFDKEEIKLIEGMPNGKDYIIFYMKLLLKSANSEGKLMFKDVIPYTVDMLSTITNTNPDTVMAATELFINLELMERLDNGALFMLETSNMVGCETEFAKKKRIYREKKSLELECNKTKKDNVRQEIEKELELELNITSSKDDLIGFEDFWNLYNKKRGKVKTQGYWKKKKFNEETVNEVLQKVKVYVANTDKQYRKDPERYVRDSCWNDEVIIKSNFNKYGKPEPKNISTAIRNTEPIDEWAEWEKLNK